ncbi:MAG: 4-hydroxybenzoate 3-monooxygenase [Pseudomonadota bacterium]
MTAPARTQVAIVGGGPSGLLLSQLLHLQGIETVVLERRSRDYVLGRIRAGVLEGGTAALLRRAGAGARMEAEGQVHHGTVLTSQRREVRIDFADLIQREVIVYGQTEVTRDLYDARDAAGGVVLDEAEVTGIEGLEGGEAVLSYTHRGEARTLRAEFVAGCDGFRGVTRRLIPSRALKEFERVYPFGWLGVLVETPPASDEVLYAHHGRGFALCSLRNPRLSRYYVQVGADEDPAAWTDDAFFDELRRRLPERVAAAVRPGPSVEKSVAPLRSYVAEPMRWGRLFLCGDAAHIVPPTGAKGLNLAASDVHYLVEALTGHYGGDGAALDLYSERALARVWKAERFSWWMTTTLHLFPDQGPFGLRMQESELDYLSQSRAARTALAENYVGLPF